MKRNFLLAASAAVVYLIGRQFLIGVEAVVDHHWELGLVLSLIYVFAMAEILWSRMRFFELESVIIALLPSHNEFAVRRWYRQTVKRMYDFRRSMITGACFLPIIISVVVWIDWNSWIHNDIVRWYDNVFHCLLMVAAASSQWPFAMISIFVMRLASKRLDINPYKHRADGIMSIGSFLLVIDLGGVGLTSLSAFCLYLSPVEVPIIVYLLFIVVYIWAGIWFFLTQFSVHRSMRENKRSYLDLVSTELMASLRLVSDDPSPENRKNFDELKQLHDHLNSLPEWPFQTQSVLTLVSAILVPITGTILDWMLSSR